MRPDGPISLDIYGQEWKAQKQKLTGYFSAKRQKRSALEHTREMEPVPPAENGLQGKSPAGKSRDPIFPWFTTSPPHRGRIRVTRGFWAPS